MQQPALPDALLVSAIFFAAGLVKGVVGMGLPTTAMGLLGLLMPVPQAAALLTLPSFVTNVWQALAGGAFRALMARLWTLQAGVLVGAALALLLPPQDERVGHILLGACLVLYGAFGLAGWRPRPVAPHTERWIAPVIGVASGVITALTGVFVLPAVPYLQSLQLDRHRLAQALGISFLTSTIALGMFLAARGALGLSGSLHSAIALAPALVGMFFGQQLRKRMSEAGFRRWFFGGLLLLGLWLVLR
jgi:uncharacterized protein